MSKPRLEFSAASRAIVGARANQEDAAALWRRNVSPVDVTTGRENGVLLLALIADGMGGHASGEIASKIAIERFVRTFEQDTGPVVTLLGHALIASNDAIDTEVRRDPALSGMGCTLVAAAFDAGGLRWCSVGDSALLLVRGGRLQRLNVDHSYGALLDERAERREISAADARYSPRRNELRSALTGKAIPMTDLRGEAFELEAGDWVVLASDGLESLTHDEINAVVAPNIDMAPEGMVETLLGAVGGLRLPTQDNTTIVAVKVVDPDATARPSPRTLATVPMSPRQLARADQANRFPAFSPLALVTAASILALGVVVYYSFSG